MTLLNMSNVQIMDVVQALSLSIERGERVGLIGNLARVKPSPRCLSCG